jgi:hypothetical protein
MAMRVTAMARNTSQTHRLAPLRPMFKFLAAI